MQPEPKRESTTAWHLLLLFILVRVSLDAFKSGSANDDSGAVDPAVLVGVAFIAFSISWLLFNSTRPASKVTILLYVLVAWAYGSAALSPYPFEAAIAATKMLAGVLMFGMLEQMLAGRADRAKQLLHTVLLSAVVPALLGLRQGLTGTGNTTETLGFNRIYGTTVHPVTFANYLILVILVAVALASQRRHWARYVAMTAVFGLLIFWTYTRSAWLVAAAGIGLILFRLNRFLLVPALGAVILVPFISPEVAARFSDITNTASYNPAARGDAQNSLLWRFSYWGQIVDLSDHTRFTGVGLDVVQRLTFLGLKPHNVMIQAYVELGVGGLAIFTAFLIGLARVLYVRRRDADTDFGRLTAALAVAVAVCMFVEALVTNPLTSTMLWWYFAAAMTYGFTEAPVTSQGRVTLRTRQASPERAR